MWGYLGSICHRWALISVGDVMFVESICATSRSVLTDRYAFHYTSGMVDKEDTQMVVESYMARMVPQRTELHSLSFCKEGPIISPGDSVPSIGFCISLTDFVNQLDHELLDEKTLSFVEAGLERIWLELSDAQVVRDAGWSLVISSLCVSIFKGIK